MSDQTQDLLTVSQAAQKLGVSRSTVHLWIRNGKLRASRVGQLRVITAEDLARAPKFAEGRGWKKGRARRRAAGTLRAQDQEPAYA